MSRKKLGTEQLHETRKVSKVYSIHSILTSVLTSACETEPKVDYGRARPAKPRADSSQSSPQKDVSGSGGESAPQRPTTSGGSARALSGSLASNRKKGDTGSPSKQRVQSPLEQSVDADSLTEELQGKESMISVIQAKLDHWEATTVATLQEIRDLKDVFAQLNAS